MKYYVIAGEASGDLHGANLMNALAEGDPQARFRCWGGDRMEAAGGELVKHIDELAFMGFAEVLANLPEILKNFRRCREDIHQWQPDVLILIDYPGFNLRMARYAKKAGIKVVYYISPQIWAWKASRIHQIRRYVDRMLVILPFEKSFYARYNYPVIYTGHPLLDALDKYRQQPGSTDSLHFGSSPTEDNRPVVAILPGSRRQEIARMGHIMAGVASEFKQYRFVVAGVDAHREEFYRKFFPKSNCDLVYGQTYSLLAQSQAAMVTSGTATLETALLGVPQLVCYRAATLSYLIARQLVKVRYISLVNLIMDKPVVRELIQHECRSQLLSEELHSLLNDDARRKQISEDYIQLRKLLGGSGASERAAHAILEFLSE